MAERKRGKRQSTAAAKAGFSERTGRDVEKLDYSNRKERTWKTRKDPFERAWEKELLPLLEKSPLLQARTLLEELQKNHSEEYPDSCLRTLQRRVREWRACHGKDREIIFRQNHPPGDQGISDFTCANALGVTIANQPFEHLLYHYRLSFSGWEYASAVLGGESFTALAEGLQNALWESGGVPDTHRTDSLSAAYRNRKGAEGEFTEAYREFCAHYGMKPTRNNKGVSHENGSIESPNRHLKSRLDQALMLRGSRDFPSVEVYREFVHTVVQKHNQRIRALMEEERPSLLPLPEYRSADFSVERAKVTSSSTILVRGTTYSVPSRLISHTLKVHLYDDRLKCFVGGTSVCELVRMRKNKRHLRQHAPLLVWYFLGKWGGELQLSQRMEAELDPQAFTGSAA